MPSMVFICSSRTSVTSLSMTAGLAPSMVVVTITKGKSTLGILSTPMVFRENRPNIISAKVAMMTVTGRLSEVSIRPLILSLLVSRCR